MILLRHDALHRGHERLRKALDESRSDAERALWEDLAQEAV
jgi:hypothetical protein